MVNADVKVVDIAYIDYNFKAKLKASQQIIDATAVDLNLNEEQKRAFRIIANHAASESPDQLRMYLEGMGGTGKSHIIRALTAMFNKRNKSHRFVVLASTGTAAALLNGSTYHSML